MEKNNSNMSFLSFVLGTYLQIESTKSYNLSNNLMICEKRTFFIPTDNVQLNYLNSIQHTGAEINKEMVNNIVNETIKINNVEINNNIIYFELSFDKKYSWLYSFDKILSSKKETARTFYMDNMTIGGHNITIYLLENDKIKNYDFVDIVIYSTIYSHVYKKPENFFIDNKALFFSEPLLKIKYESSTNYYINVINNEYKFCKYYTSEYKDQLILERGYSYIFKIVVKKFPFNIGNGWRESNDDVLIISDSKSDMYKIKDVESIEAPNILYVELPLDFRGDLYYYNFNDSSMTKKIKIVNKLL